MCLLVRPVESVPGRGSSVRGVEMLRSQSWAGAVRMTVDGWPGTAGACGSELELAAAEPSGRQVEPNG
jgi:hypothetical protein